MAAQPQWIAKMYPPKAGRDHLGLGSVSSNEILEKLSPGIMVLTPHPRYYSLFVFLLDEFWRRDDRPRSYDEWVKFFRPRDFIFSVGANLCSASEHGKLENIVGSQKTESLAKGPLHTFEMVDKYIVSSLSGYGLYYRNVMITLGLIEPGGPGFLYPLDVPSKDKGKQLAEAFRQAVKDTEYYQNYFSDDNAKVPRKVVQEYIRKACLCQLQTEYAPDRLLLREIFLTGGEEDEAKYRRESLRLFLDIADQTQSFAVDQDVFRQLLYFRAAKNGAYFQPQQNIKQVYEYWRLYQLREYYSFALHAMWYYLCDWGLRPPQSGDIRPVPITNLWNSLDAALDFDKLLLRLSLSSPKLTPDSPYSSLLHWLCQLVGTDCNNFDEKCRLSTPVNEHILYELAMNNRTSAEVMVAGMLILLSIIFLRFRSYDIRSREEWRLISMRGFEGRLSVEGFFHQLEHRMKDPELPIRAVVEWLFRDYIILQHQLVATSKLPENTFRFSQEGGNLRFFRLENALSFRDSRFSAISTSVYELGFCGDFRQPKHPLTSDGRQLLDKGVLS